MLDEAIIFSIRQLFGRKASAPAMPAASPAQAPAQAAALKAKGNTLLAQGDVAAATQCYRQACELAPGDAPAWLNLGYGLLELGELEAAEQALTRSLELNRTVADTHFFLAQLRLRERRRPEAISFLRHAVVLNPGFDVAGQLLVSTLLDMRYMNEALMEVEGLLRHVNTLELQVLKVRALAATKHREQALALSDELVAAYPQRIEPTYAKAQALFELRRYSEALDACAAVLHAQPAHVEAMVNSGAACARLDRWDEAAAFYDRALALRPDYPLALYNKSSMYQELARIPEMLALVERGLALQPGEPSFVWSRGIALLLLGDLAGGFRDYETRWVLEIAEARPQGKPQWRGEDLRGKTIYVYDEQGLGDTLQMMRYAPLLVERGARVLLRVQPSLLPLVEEWRGCTLLRERGHPHEASYDFHCPMLSLPLAFGTVLDTVPWAGPYVAADPQLRAQWQGWLGPRRGLRVGLVWSGNADHRNDANRSMRLETVLAGLADEGHHLVSLQREVRPVDLPALASIQHAGELLRSFADTAALADCMDVVVSVDTSVAHLAGALGKKLWVLLPQAPDWRWLVEGDTTPWYPQARLFRQGADRQWATVMTRVADALAQERDKEGMDV